MSIKSYFRNIYFHIPWDLRLPLDGFRRLGYIPSTKNPITFNDKIQLRKKSWRNQEFSTFSDKARSKELIANLCSADLITPNLFTGRTISTSILKHLLKQHEQFVVKTNHGSGSVFFCNQSSDLELIVATTSRDLRVDYGKYSGESWYSQIEPMVLIEENIACFGSDLPDYKFHVFDSGNIILQVDFARFENHQRSFFDSELNYLDFESIYPSNTKQLSEPKHFRAMLEAAKSIGERFSYSRVDLYSLETGPRFGEVTFAHESGFGRFRPYSADEFVGAMWSGDPTI